MLIESQADLLTTPATWAKAIIDTLEEGNVDVAPILKEMGLDRALFNTPDLVLPQDTVSALWEKAVSASGNDNIGFEVGRRIHTVLSPVIAYSLMSCSNLKESCDRLFRYQDLVAQGLQFSIAETKNTFVLYFDILSGSQPPSSQAIKSVIPSSLVSSIG